MTEEIKFTLSLYYNMRSPTINVMSRGLKNADFPHRRAQLEL